MTDSPSRGIEAVAERLDKDEALRAAAPDLFAALERLHSLVAEAMIDEAIPDDGDIAEATRHAFAVMQRARGIPRADGEPCAHPECGTVCGSPAEGARPLR